MAGSKAAGDTCVGQRFSDVHMVLIWSSSFMHRGCLRHQQTSANNIAIGMVHGGRMYAFNPSKIRLSSHIDQIVFSTTPSKMCRLRLSLGVRQF
jgi:hypothetical protein